MQVIKGTFFQKHTFLLSSQQCRIFLALRQMSDKKNFTLKQKIHYVWFFLLNVIVEILKYPLCFSAVMAMSES